MIPKILLQTSKKKLPKYVTDSLYQHISDEWYYFHFTDDEILEFFKQNPIDGFLDISEVFNSIPRGEYKADLFRYYFLYLNGGVFVDSDLHIKTDLGYYIENFEFFATQAVSINSHAYFQGFLGSIPNNIIIYEALVDTYNLFKNKKVISDYLEICNRFKTISLKYQDRYKTKIFNEIDNDGYTYLVDNTKHIGIHYHEPGIIPPPISGQDSTSRRQMIRAIYLNYLNREPDSVGLENYINSKMRIHEIVTDILHSSEFKNLQLEK